MITYSAPASLIIAPDTSPVKAPSRSQYMFCAATPILLLLSASATAWIAVNGGAITISTSATSFTATRSSLANTTASLTVLYIFQLAAMNGVRIDRILGQEGPPSRRRRYGEVAPKLVQKAARAKAEQDRLDGREWERHLFVRAATPGRVRP